MINPEPRRDGPDTGETRAAAPPDDEAAGRPGAARPGAPHPDAPGPDASRPGGSAQVGLEDAVLVAQVLAGDPNGYATLVRRHQDGLYRHALSMGLDHDTALDLVQDSLVRAYESLARCQDPPRFGLWVFRILRNRCLDHLKDIRRRSLPIEDAGLASDDDGPDGDVVRIELRGSLQEAFGALPDDLRDAFLMKHHEGRSYHEMAEVAGASVSAMKMRVHRARDALREYLEGVGIAGPTGGLS